MAELCEICFKVIERWQDTNGNVTYEGIILCKNCQEEVERLYDKHEGNKTQDKCIEEIKKKRRLK